MTGGTFSSPFLPFSLSLDLLRVAEFTWAVWSEDWELGRCPSYQTAALHRQQRSNLPGHWSLSSYPKVSNFSLQFNRYQHALKKAGLPTRFSPLQAQVQMLISTEMTSCKWEANEVPHRSIITKKGENWDLQAFQWTAFTANCQQSPGNIQIYHLSLAHSVVLSLCYQLVI